MAWSLAMAQTRKKQSFEKLLIKQMIFCWVFFITKKGSWIIQSWFVAYSLRGGWYNIIKWKVSIKVPWAGGHRKLRRPYLSRPLQMQNIWYDCFMENDLPWRSDIHWAILYLFIVLTLYQNTTGGSSTPPTKHALHYSPIFALKGQVGCGRWVIFFPTPPPDIWSN